MATGCSSTSARGPRTAPWRWPATRVSARFATSASTRCSRTWSSARATVEAEGLESRITLEIGDARALDVDDGEVDTAISRSTPHHWRGSVRAVREMRRGPTPSGAAIVQDARRDPIRTRAPPSTRRRGFPRATCRRS